MSGEEELPFLKAHQAELSSAVLQQLKWDILAEKKRETEASAKLKCRAIDPLASTVGFNPALPGGGEDCGLPVKPPEGKGKAN
jgi:hypothetical protein